MFLIPVVLVDFRGKFEHVFSSLHHICTHKEGVSASISYIACEDVCRWKFSLQPFLTALDIIKLINLMADPESFKRQSPVTTEDSTIVKCKWFRTSEWLQKKEIATGPIRKQR